MLLYSENLSFIIIYGHKLYPSARLKGEGGIGPGGLKSVGKAIEGQRPPLHQHAIDIR